MATKVRKSFLFSGTPVITDDGQKAIVEFHNSDAAVTIRYHRDGWPFPTWDVKPRKLLKPIVFEHPEALF